MGGIEYPHDALNVLLSTPKNLWDSPYSGSTSDTAHREVLLPNSGRLLDILPFSRRLQSYPTICVSVRGGVFYYLLPLVNPFYFNRFAAFFTSQCFAEIHIPPHILVLCSFKCHLVVYLTIEIVGFSEKLSLVVIRASASAPTVRSTTSKLGCHKRL